MNTNRKIEIESPAGNFEKLVFGLAYGADAVYFGGGMLNLRSNAGNFSIDQIEKAIAYCRERGVRPVFLLNSFLHEGDIEPARQYLRSLRHIDFDSLMISDPGMLALVKEEGLKGELQLSTQMSTLNHYAVKFWQQQGIKRIVLARETTLEEIRMIRQHTDAEIEIFAHGALCIAYSGRCLLSRYFSGRDSNQGNCSQPCRWGFSLVEEKRRSDFFDITEYSKGTEILSSKDLCLIDMLPAYVEAGVDAFKIEGRMKSVYHVANITRIYRDALDTIQNGGDYQAKLPFWKEELDLVSHRPFTDDLFNEFENGFEPVSYINKAQYCGCHAGETDTPDRSLVKASNPIRPGDSFDVIYPLENGKFIDGSITVIDITENGNPTDMARPDRICGIRFDTPLKKFGILRKRTA